MNYIPNPHAVRQQMLERLGMSDMGELFSDIPKSLKVDSLNLGRGLSEMEIQRELSRLADKNLKVTDCPTFLGAGAYDHYIPVAIDQIISRSEFYTAYTPYQAEISQGVLQSIFEFQSMICALTGMDVANASIYDGASSLAEACNVAVEQTRRKKILVPDTVNRSYIEVLKTYAISGITEVVVIPTEGGQAGDELLSAIDKETAAVIVQYPNFYGALEGQIAAIEQAVHQNKGLLIMVADPIALGMLKPPSELGADIVVGEGQPMGLSLSYGGPYLGFFAASEKLMRRVPGRLVGQTTDRHGKRAFVLTLQAREQHIRRERASSNICSNQALMALAAAIYLSLVGPRGLRAIAERCHQLASYAQQQLEKAGLSLLYDQPFFKEFAVKVDNPAAKNKELLAAGIIGGYELKDGLLLAFTEKRTKEEIDHLVAVLGGKANE